VDRGNYGRPDAHTIKAEPGLWISRVSVRSGVNARAFSVMRKAAMWQLRAMTGSSDFSD
jgi:hypothetical protein